MSNCAEQQRVACAVGGIYTALAIERVLPIMHCGPGCYGNVSCVLGSMNGGQSGETYSGSIIPSTNFCEDDVVFGGAERLRKLVGECLKYYDSDMFLLVDGCTAEIVGDDIGEVAGSFQGNGVPVLFASLPGFKGNNVWGHGRILEAIVDQYLTPADAIDPLQVNILGIVPYYDSMWVATLERVEKLLLHLGLRPNIIYGRNRGVAAVNKIPAAGFNLVLAPWTDLGIAEKLQDKFGTPYLHYSNVPIGPTETAKFIRTLVDYAGLDKGGAEAYIRDQEDRYYYYLHRSISWIYGCKNYPREFVINSSAAQSVSLTKFLVNDLGMLPKRIYILDDVPEEHQERIRGDLLDIEYDEKDSVEIVFTNDGGLFEVSIRDEDFSIRKICIFGAAWDLLPAKNNKLTFLPVSAPYGDVMVGNKTYFGYDGAISLMTDLYTSASDNNVDPGI
jgi:nitrogenase molybdenum-iron protein beta chain